MVLVLFPINRFVLLRLHSKDALIHADLDVLFLHARQFHKDLVGLGGLDKVHFGAHEGIGVAGGGGNVSRGGSGVGGWLDAAEGGKVKGAQHVHHLSFNIIKVSKCHIRVVIG